MQATPARTACRHTATGSKLVIGKRSHFFAAYAKSRLQINQPARRHVEVRLSAAPLDDDDVPLDGDLVLPVEDLEIDALGKFFVPISDRDAQRGNLDNKWITGISSEHEGEEEEEEEEDPAARRSPRGRGRVVQDDLEALSEAGGVPVAATAEDAGSEGTSGEYALEAGPIEYSPRPERRWQLPALLVAAGYAAQAATAPDVEIRNIITCNSDQGGEGSLYVCVPAEEGSEDGHDYADDSLDHGAVAVLAQRPLDDCLLPVVEVPDTLRALGRLAAVFYDNPSSKLHTVALVGSYGKTTVSWLARGLLEEAGELTGMVGNTENTLAEDRLTREGDFWEAEEEDPTQNRDCSAPFHIAPYRGKYEQPGTTPDALHLHKLLAGMADRGAGSALVEVCPTLAADGRVEELQAEVVVFTNVEQEKAEADPQGADAYVERIAGMFERLQPSQTAIINVDDSNGPMLARLASDTGAQVLTFASTADNKDADLYAERVKCSMWDTEVLVRTPVGRLEIILPLVGKFTVANVLAAVAVGLARGVKLVSIVAGIEAVEIVPGRCELIDEGQPFPVIVDAARTPEQLSRLIDDVKERGARRTVLVMGCPGSAPQEHRAAMGSMAHFKADIVFFTNDSPELDLPDEIISDVIGGMPEEILNRHAGSYAAWLQDPHRTPPWFQKWLLQYQSEVGRYVIEDRFTAIRVAIGMARPRDVVLVTGRGHRDFIDVWDGESPNPRGEDGADSTTIRGWFDDRVECRCAVSRLGYLNNLKDLDRNALPWTRYPEERESLEPSGGPATDGPAAGQYLEQYLRGPGEVGMTAAAAEEEEEEEEEEEFDEEEAGAF